MHPPLIIPQKPQLGQILGPFWHKKKIQSKVVPPKKSLASILVLSADVTLCKENKKSSMH